MPKHYTIPLFIPHEGCPHQCVFCDQNKISGSTSSFDEKSIADTIEQNLSTMPNEGVSIDVGFFGGTFTSLPLELQETYLKQVFPYMENKSISGIRLSTRPDSINDEVLDLLQQYRVSCIELGVQSMSDVVLNAVKRGYLSKDVESASEMIRSRGIALGHQMMVGLPESSFEDEMFTAERAASLGAEQVRIYPLVVIKGTELESLWENKTFMTISEEEAIRRCARLLLYFEFKEIKVIRCGLHPSEGLADGTEYVAGPFHPSFRQKVDSSIFRMILEKIREYGNVREISINPSDANVFFGHKKENSDVLESIQGFVRSKLVRDSGIHRGTVHVKNEKGEKVFSRMGLAKELIPGLEQ